MAADTEVKRRTYGGWTRPKSFGLFGLGSFGTGLIFGYLTIAILALAIGGAKAALIWCLIGGVMLAPLLVRNPQTGRNGLQIIGVHLGWLHRKHGKQEHIYVPGKIGPVAFGQRNTPLPGILAKSELIEAEDFYGNPFTLVHYPQVHHYAVPIKVEPEGSALVDQDTVDTWVGWFDRWMANLADLSGLVAASVTMEVAPDHGHTLRAEVNRLLSSDGPQLRKQVLTEATANYPVGSARINAYVTLTFSAARDLQESRELFTLRSGDKPRKRIQSSGEMAARIGGILNSQLRDLEKTGISLARPMRADELAEQVRIAYDPAIAETIDACHANNEPTGVTWANAGPQGSHELWGSYRHDSGHSVTWQMVEAPRGLVEDRVLQDLLSANDAVTSKRVTFIYRLHDPSEAPDVVDSDVRTARSLASSKKGPATANAELAIEATQRAAREEASGAGVVRFSALVTATVTDAALVDEAVAATTQDARASRIRLRRVYGSQAAAFQQALGFVGIIPTSHVAIPAVLRDKL